MVVTWEGLIESVKVESGPIVQFDEDGFTVDFTSTGWEQVQVVILDDDFEEGENEQSVSVD